MSKLYNWDKRIDNANTAYREWAGKYRCALLEDYYRGFQWRSKGGTGTGYNPYTLNLVYSTIQIKLANFVFQKPSFVVSPAQGHYEYDIDTAVKGAYLKQDVLNTIIKSRRVKFTKHLKLAALDSFFRFGMIEVGYATDFRNPSEDTLHLKEWSQEEASDTNEKPKLVDSSDRPKEEKFYVKRIRPESFRCAISTETDLEDLPWCGYYEYIATNQLKAIKGIKFPKDATVTQVSRDYSSGIVDDTADSSEEIARIRRLTDGSISKVWHIFDSVAEKRYLLLDKFFGEPLWEDDMYRLPLIDHRWIPNLEGFYPIPPVWYWISPQDEINEAREQTRSYRRRFTRKFQVIQDRCDTEEQEKFVSGPDGTLITVKSADAISPIQNPEQGPTAEAALMIAKDDFNIVSGTSAEARGQKDRETATAAKLVDARSQIRESVDQLDFNTFVSNIGREVLMQVHERLSEGMMTKLTSSPNGESLVQSTFQYIQSAELRDGYDFEVDVDIQNATPAAMAATQQAFIQFLTLMKNFPELVQDPTLIREAAYRVGYRNEQVISKYQKVAQAQIAMQLAQAQAKEGVPGQAGGPNSDNAAKATLGQMATPSSDTIGKQLENQVGGGMLQ